MNAGRDAVLGGVYRRLLKPLLFRLDAETVHERVSGLGAWLGRSAVTRGLTRTMFGYDHPSLRTTVAGIALANPIGLSAGFDKEGKLLDIIPEVGFGFLEIGSVTGTPSPGNPKPRLWRLPRSQSLVVNYGLNSSGSAAVAERLRRRRCRTPLAISIAKANIPACDGVAEGIADYVTAGRNLRGLGDLRVINISCPNAIDGEPFTEPANLERLLSSLDPLLRDLPVFIKLPVDLPLGQLDELLAVAQAHPVTGFICANLSKDRRQTVLRETVVPPRGGLSGKPIEQRANDVLAHVYRRTGGRQPLIGVGGVFTAADAYRKIRLGASLVELITGMIFRGPSVVSEIKRGLVTLLERDGFASIGQAVGVDAPPSF